MKTKKESKVSKALRAACKDMVKVWRVMETSHENPQLESIVLATSAEQAARVVGETPFRRIKFIAEIGTITESPNDAYRAVDAGREYYWKGIEERTAKDMKAKDSHA